MRLSALWNDQLRTGSLALPRPQSPQPPHADANAAVTAHNSVLAMITPMSPQR
jgi:hypothetical protein